MTAGGFELGLLCACCRGCCRPRGKWQNVDLRWPIRTNRTGPGRDRRRQVAASYSATVREAQSRHLCRAFTLMFYGLQNIFRKESRYFLQYLNKFPFMVIVSNFEEITPPPTNLKVPYLWSDFSVSNSVRSNFLNRSPHKILISTMSFILQN